MRSDRGPDAPPPQIRAAGALVGLQGLAALGFAVVVGLQSSGQPFGSVAGEVGYFVLIGLALTFIGAALLAGRRGARTPQSSSNCYCCRSSTR